MPNEHQATRAASLFTLVADSAWTRWGHNGASYLGRLIVRSEHIEGFESPLHTEATPSVMLKGPEKNFDGACLNGRGFDAFVLPRQCIQQPKGVLLYLVGNKGRCFEEPSR